MSLPQPVWTRLPRQAGIAGTGKAFATAAATALSSLVDFEGNARVPGVGDQWSVASTHYDLPAANDGAIYATPGAGSGASGGVIIGMAAGALSPPALNPVMGLNEVYLASCPMIGSGIDAGQAVTAWSGSAAGNPLGVGKRFMGFGRMSSTAVAGVSYLDLWTCADAIFYAFKLGAVVHYGCSHGLIDPRTSVYTPLREELDRRVYGTAVRGATATAQPSWESSVAGASFCHGTAVLVGRFFVNQPGFTNNLAAYRPNWANTGVVTALAAAARYLNGEYATEELAIHWTNAGERLGTLRGVQVGWTGRHGQRIPAAGPLKGWLVGNDDLSDVLTWYLPAV